MARIQTSEPSDPDFKQFPALTYYYGLSPAELYKLPRSVVQLYADELPALIAETQLREIQAAAYPYMKKGAMDRTVRRLERIMNRNKPEPELPSVSEDQIASGAVPIMGVGVKLVDKNGEEVTTSA